MSRIQQTEAVADGRKAGRPPAGKGSRGMEETVVKGATPPLVTKLSRCSHKRKPLTGRPAFLVAQSGPGFPLKVPRPHYLLCPWLPGRLLTLSTVTQDTC